MIKNQYKNDKPHGLWEYYYANSKVCFKGNYKNGKRHGLWEHYYHNGNLNHKGNYKNGKQHGYSEEYCDFDEVMLYKKFHI